MTEIHHLNCVTIITADNKLVSGHCLLVNQNNTLVLIDTGIGFLDTQNPNERIGQPLINMVGYRFDEQQTALRQIESLGWKAENVTDCVISHLDNDHIGGLPDFPNAIVHLGAEELANFHSGNSRYLKLPLAHNPTIKTYAETDCDWFGFKARKVHTAIEAEIYLIPLFGHTLGHCGVALKIENKWLFYVADAYYLKAELTDDNHPITELAKNRAENNYLRIESVNKIKQLIENHPEIDVFGYHDIEEFNFYVN